MSTGKMKLLHKKVRRSRRRGITKYPAPREIITTLIILLILLSSPFLIAFAKQIYDDFYAVDDDVEKPPDHYEELTIMNTTANRIEKKFQDEKLVMERFLKLLEEDRRHSEKKKKIFKTKKNGAISLAMVIRRLTTKQFQIKFL